MDLQVPVLGALSCALNRHLWGQTAYTEAEWIFRADEYGGKFRLVIPQSQAHNAWSRSQEGTTQLCDTNWALVHRLMQVMYGVCHPQLQLLKHNTVLASQDSHVYPHCQKGYRLRTKSVKANTFITHSLAGLCHYCGCHSIQHRKIIRDSANVLGKRCIADLGFVVRVVFFF